MRAHLIIIMMQTITNVNGVSMLMVLSARLVMKPIAQVALRVIIIYQLIRNPVLLIVLQHLIS